MRSLILLLALCAFHAVATAQSLPTAVMVPEAAEAPGRDLEVELVVLNDRADAQPLGLPAELRATLSTADTRSSVLLRAQSAVDRTVPAGGFVRVPYRLTVPDEVRSEAILSFTVDGQTELRAVIRLAAALPPTDESGPPALTPPPLAPADLAATQRTFAGRFAPHESIYFIYGPDTPGAKFQFSFKYRLLSAGRLLRNPGSRLQFAYTQRSLWDIDAASSPFYDTSYMPAVFYEHTPTAPGRGGGIAWLGLQSGYQHESNGRDGPDSRSLNTLFVRSGFTAGRLDGWHATALLRAYGYVGGLSDNPDLTDYRGYGDWQVGIAHGDGARLTYTGRAGRDFDRCTTQLDLSVPVQFRLLDFATFFLVQYFNGYGESLRSYETRSETVRAGFSFVR